MKRNKNAGNESSWDALVDRYFRAETTPREERRLRRFLSSPAGAARRYDAVRAVMAYVACGRSLSRRPAARRRNRPSAVAWRVAATVCLTAGIAASAGWDVYRRNNVCVAYVAGQKVTDPDIVTRCMKDAFRETVGPEAAPTMEGQLNGMFNLLDNP